MAMMLDSFASKLGNMLAEMARDEAVMLLGVTEEIEKLQTTLRDLSNFLADAERRRITDQTVQAWVLELKDVMYDADDILDECRIKADQRRERLPVPCCGIPLHSCLRNPLFAHRIGSSIKKLNQRLESIARRRTIFNFSHISSYEDRQLVPHHDSRATHPVIVSGDIVGEKIARDTRRLVAMLTMKERRPDNILVIAIVGVGGIGKTTLAKKIFNDEKVQDEFNKTVWVCISQVFDGVKLLQNVVTAVEGGNSVQDQDVARLVPMLKKAVIGKKLLLVMDDMWSSDAWTKFLRDPLVASGSDCRILVTTRNENVSLEMNAFYCHHVERLDPEDGWSLLKNEAMLDDDVSKSLMDIGIQIIGRCGGLPLAIKALGGLLCTKNRTTNDWESVLESTAWSISGLDSEVNRALYLSYEGLPSHLKQCFVYCSLFPEDKTFLMHDIVSMWISEGFVHSVGAFTSLEDVGEQYYRQLLMRNLLEPNDEYYNREGCRMHDLVRSLGHFLSKDECLVLGEKHKLETGNAPAKLRRISILQKEVDLKDVEKKESLRSLLLFGNSMVKLNNLNHLSCLHLLRLEGANITSLPDSLCCLKHLRYLQLSFTEICRLPRNIENLKCLQYLGLSYCSNLIDLPGGIMKLCKLRTLLIHGTAIEGIPRGLSNLQNLVGLSGCRMQREGAAKGWSSLEELGPLSQLKDLSIERLEEAFPSFVAAGAQLGNKVQLRNLCLRCNTKIRDREKQQRIEEVFDNLCPPSCLETLEVDGYFGHRLPRWMTMTSSMMMKALENLRRLDLTNLPYCDQLPVGLGQLPNLDYLLVERAPTVQCIGHDFLIFPQSQCGTTFPKLEGLHLLGMEEWKEWIWDKELSLEDAMPNLRILSIVNCKLSCLPPGLAHHARVLGKLTIDEVSKLTAIENFPQLNELGVFDSPNLEKIANLPNLRKLTVIKCPKLKELEGLKELESIKLEDYNIETLPEYLQEANLKKLEVYCSLYLLKQISMGDIGANSEWNKIKHIQQVKAYDPTKSSHVLYTKEPFSLAKIIVIELEIEAGEEE